MMPVENKTDASDLATNEPSQIQQQQYEEEMIEEDPPEDEDFLIVTGTEKFMVGFLGAIIHLKCNYF